MGPQEFQPDLPEYEFALVSSGHRFVSKCPQSCNWLQALEGGIDSSRVSWLQSDALRIGLHKKAGTTCGGVGGIAMQDASRQESIGSYHGPNVHPPHSLTPM
jgi:hypothetical protein